jgi:hypothetical protein
VEAYVSGDLFVDIGTADKVTQPGTKGIYLVDNSVQALKPTGIVSVQLTFLGMCASSYYHYLIMPHTFFCLTSGTIAVFTSMLMLQDAMLKSLICASAHLEAGGENVRFVLQNGRSFECKVKDIEMKKFNSKQITLNVTNPFNTNRRMDVSISLDEKGNTVDH